MTNQKPDIVGRALSELMRTQDPEHPPQEVTKRVLDAIQHRENSVQPRIPDPHSFREQIAWLPLSACLLIIVIGSWYSGYNSFLWSQVSGRQIYADGTVWVHYSDGRVIPKTKI